ncbi:MAG: WD40 repeat protein [Pirellulaceae bacterium]|jgi:WD40 repeat protein
MKIDKPQQQWELACNGDWPTSVAFVGNNRLVAGNRTGDIFVWELPDEVPEEGKDGFPNVFPTRRLVGHSNAITHLLVTPDGKTVISASLDRTIRLWNIDLDGPNQSEVVLDTQNREKLARGKKEEEKEEILNAPGCRVQDVAPTATLEDHQDWIKALNISRDGKRLISGDDSCLSIVWDLASLKQISSWHGYDRVWVSSAALSPDGETAFVAEFAGRRSSFDCPAPQVRLWNTSDGKLKTDLLKIWTPDVKDEDRVDSYGYFQTCSKIVKRGLICAAFSDDGKMIAAAQGGETDTGQIHLIDSESGAIIRTVSGHKSGACDVKFSADSKYVVSSGRDTAVRICQVDDGKEVAVLGTGRGGQFKDWIHAISISPDQKRIAGADIAGMIHVWTL